MRPRTTTAAALLLAGLSSTAWAVQPAVPDATYSDQAAFAAAAGALVTESFETTATSPRGLADIVAPLLTVRTAGTPIGLLDGGDGFGGGPADGQRFVSVYQPNQVQGPVQFKLAAPSQAFGFAMVDLGEVAGTLTLTTDTGAYAGGVVLASFGGGLSSGNRQFFGITQTQAFSSVWLTASGLDDAYALDSVQLQAPVPEPGQLALLTLGLAGLAGVRALRRRAQC